MTTIALFGTSADPPTIGHQMILRWLAKHYDSVAVWAADNPMKSGQTPLAHRMAMLRLVVQAVQQDHPNVMLHPELSEARTLHTIHRAQELWGTDVALTFVVGSDLLPQLSQWYHIKTLLQLITLLVVPRPGYPITAGDRAHLQRLGATYHLANLLPPVVSSSHYRQEGNSAVIPPPVADYIAAQHLYPSLSGRSQQYG